MPYHGTVSPTVCPAGNSTRLPHRNLGRSAGSLEPASRRAICPYGRLPRNAAPQHPSLRTRLPRPTAYAALNSTGRGNPQVPLPKDGVRRAAGEAQEQDFPAASSMVGGRTRDCPGRETTAGAHNPASSGHRPSKSARREARPSLTCRRPPLGRAGLPKASIRGSSIASGNIGRRPVEGEQPAGLPTASHRCHFFAHCGSVGDPLLQYGKITPETRHRHTLCEQR